MCSFSKRLKLFLMLLFNTVCCHFLLEITALIATESKAWNTGSCPLPVSAQPAHLIRSRQ